MKVTIDEATAVSLVERLAADTDPGLVKVREHVARLLDPERPGARLTSDELQALIKFVEDDWNQADFQTVTKRALPKLRAMLQQGTDQARPASAGL